MFHIYKTVPKQFIAPDESVAYGLGKDILRLEEQLGLMFELDLRRWVLDQGDWLIKSFNNVYACYMWGFQFGILSLAFMALHGNARRL